MQFCFRLVIAASAFTVGAPTIHAQEDAKDVVAAQIRSQGYECASPQSARREPKASRPDEMVWLLQCEGSTYRVRLIPHLAAKVERVDKKP
jgi:hypothetical protein